MAVHLNSARIYVEDTFAMKTEIALAINQVNSNLDKYALNSQLEEYRKKEDLTANVLIDLPFEHKPPPAGPYEFTIETAFLEFHEGAVLEGYAMVYNPTTKGYDQQEFSITFHTSYTDGPRHMHDVIISSAVQGFWWEEDKKAFYASGDISIAVHLNSARIYGEDTFAMKFEVEALRTENEELKTKITALEARLTALENR